MFATWYTSDIRRDGWWLAATVNRTSEGTDPGTVNQTTGPAFSAETLDSANVTAPPSAPPRRPSAMPFRRKLPA
jgi:hypothetical protein